MSGLFDSHCHVQAEDFNRDRDAVLARATDAGVREMVVVGEGLASSRAAVELCAGSVGRWAAVGLHPHFARDATVDFDAELRELAQEPPVVAIGEIGLDYHYDRSPRPVQRNLFERQLAVAADAGLSVVIHSREAEDDTLAILGAWSAARRSTGARGPLGVMHCFGYGVVSAARFIDLGWMVSVPGTVTFPRSETVRQVARDVPDDSLLIETDAPVLAPVPFRGKRNEPANLVHVARAVAEIRGVSVDALADLTSENARRLFRVGVPAAAGESERA